MESLELEETEKLTELWEQRLGDFKQNAAESRRAMEDRHVREHQELRQRIYAPLEKPKWSAHLLNLRKIQVAVAQQQDYGRAHMIQQQGNMLQAQEMRVMELEAMSRHKVGCPGNNSRKGCDYAAQQQRQRASRRLPSTNSL